MVQTRNPAGEGGASDGSVHAAKLNTSDHTRPTEPHQVVRDCLMGSGASSAAGVTVSGHAPVLELCRRLVAVGHDPTTPLAVVGTPMHDETWWAARPSAPAPIGRAWSTPRSR